MISERTQSKDNRRLNLLPSDHFQWIGSAMNVVIWRFSMTSAIWAALISALFRFNKELMSCE